MQNSTQQIKFGALISYIALGINILASLIYMPWMVAMIGKSNYALYTLASSFIALFITDFGLSSSVSRFVAKYNAEGKQDSVNEVISTIARLYLIIDGCILLILGTLYFFIGSIYTGLTEQEIVIFRQLYIIVAINSLISFPFLPLSGILNAYELFIQQKCAELFNKFFSIFLIVLALLNGGDVITLVIANVISGILTIGLKLFFVSKHTKIEVKLKKFNKTIFSEVAKFSVWVTVMSLAQRCIFNLAPTILGIVSDSTEIALFGPANALEGYFYSVSAAVNGLFLATVSRYVANNEDDRIYQLMIRVGRFQFTVMGLIFVVFLCAGEDFLLQWMGPDFIKAWPCALILFIPDVLIFSQQIANTTVIAKNKVKEQAVGYIIMAVSCVAISFPMSKKLGALGACIAISISYFILFAFMNILYYRELKINVFGFFKECYLKLGLPMIAVTLVSLVLCRQISLPEGWSRVILKGALVSALYVIMIMLFLDKTERAMIKRLFHRRNS